MVCIVVATPPTGPSTQGEGTVIPQALALAQSAWVHVWCWLTIVGSSPLSQVCCKSEGSVVATTVSPKHIQQILNEWRMNEHFFCEMDEVPPFDRVLWEPNAVMWAHGPLVDAGWTLVPMPQPADPRRGPWSPCSPMVRQLCWSYAWLSLVSLSFPRWSETRGFPLLVFLLVSSESILPLVKGSKLITSFPPTTPSPTTNWLDISPLLCHFGIFWVRYK